MLASADLRAVVHNFGTVSSRSIFAASLCVMTARTLERSTMKRKRAQKYVRARRVPVQIMFSEREHAGLTKLARARDQSFSGAGAPDDRASHCCKRAEARRRVARSETTRSVLTAAARRRARSSTAFALARSRAVASPSSARGDSSRINIAASSWCERCTRVCMRRHLQIGRTLAACSHDRRNDRGDQIRHHPTRRSSATGTELVEVGTPTVTVQHHRLGGSAGVRVTQQGGLTEHKRVGAVEPDDHKRVPRDVLAAVRDLIDARAQTQLTATERLLAVYDLLTPWLDVD